LAGSRSEPASAGQAVTVVRSDPMWLPKLIGEKARVSAIG
jgi:hypothetical protein